MEYSFQASLGCWKVFVNDQGTRTFLALGMMSGRNKVSAALHKFLLRYMQNALRLTVFEQINTMIDCVNDSFRSHSLRTFYQVKQSVHECGSLFGNEVNKAADDETDQDGEVAVQPHVQKGCSSACLQWVSGAMQSARVRCLLIFES